MERRLPDVPLELGGSDGACSVCSASDFRPAITIHCRLLWLHRYDHLFRGRGKSIQAWLRCCKTLLTLPSAPLHDLDSIFGYCAARGFGMVFGQLLPNGKHWVALCRQGWKQSGRRMDERLRDE